MKNHLLLFILIISSIFIISCKTYKITIEIKDQVQLSTKLPSDIIIQDNNFDWFDGKFNADINVDGKPNSVKGRVRIRKDSLIWISIKPDIAIIEAFRILISPDSVHVVDYINKKFFSDKFSAVKDFINYDLSFDMIENIFLGNPTYIIGKTEMKVYTNKSGDEIMASSDFKSYVDARNSSQPANFLFQALWFNNQLHKRNLIYDPKNKVELDLQYTLHEMVDSNLLPKTLQLTLVSDSSNTRFGIDYTKIILNSSFDFPFSIPDNYERMYLK